MPWRQSLPEGSFEIFKQGFTLFENHALGAWLPEQLGRVWCQLHGMNPGIVYIACQGPQAPRRRLYAPNKAGVTLEGASEFLRLTTRIAPDGSFVVDQRWKDAEYRIVGRVASSGGAVSVTLDNVYYKAICTNVICNTGVYTELDLYDPPLTLDRDGLKEGETSHF